jgi:hypothetical protein
MVRIIVALAFALALSSPGEARAKLFNFSFGTNAAGTFETGAASIADPGYYLVTDLTITSFNGEVVDVHATGFQPGAAFNPATGAFLNHAAGGTFPDIGRTLVNGIIGGNSVSFFSGKSFQQSRDRLDISSEGGPLSAFGLLAITRAPAPVIEPAGLALLATGLLGLAATRGRRSSGSRAATGCSF